MYREVTNTNNGIKTEQTVARPEDPTVPAEERKDHSHTPTPPHPHPHTLHTEVDGVVIADVQRLLSRQTIELIEPEHSSTAVHDHTPHTVTHHNPVGGTPTQSSLQQLTDTLNLLIMDKLNTECQDMCMTPTTMNRVHVRQSCTQVKVTGLKCVHFT